MQDNLPNKNEFIHLSTTSVCTSLTKKAMQMKLCHEPVFQKTVIFNALFRLKGIRLPDNLHPDSTRNTSFTYLGKDDKAIYIGLTGQYWKWFPRLLIQGASDFYNRPRSLLTDLLWIFRTEDHKLSLEVWCKHDNKQAEKKFKSYWFYAKYMSYVARQVFLFELKTALTN